MRGGWILSKLLSEMVKRLCVKYNINFKYHCMKKKRKGALHCCAGFILIVDANYLKKKKYYPLL